MAVKTVEKAEEKAEEKTAEKILVIIPRPKTITGDEECTVSVNGTMYQIKYDEPVEVPKNIAEIIETHKELQAKISIEEKSAVMEPGKQAIADL